MLAAFAVTVGSDGAVADLMGLNEREVRVARRTVGKDDARTVAQSLLSVPGVPGTAPPQPEEESVLDMAFPHPRAETPVPAPAHTMPIDYGARPADNGVHWTPGMDSVLQWSWQSGLDLQAVAEELGLSPRALLLRAQTLATEGRLAPKAADSDATQSGRHRRNSDALYAPVPDTIESLHHSPAPHGWAHS